MTLAWPAYLLGFLGIGLPWLLHRFSNQQPPEQPFPSTRFLQPAKPPASRQKKLRHRLLFALRLLMLAGLCLLFAEPWLRTESTAFVGKQVHLIALDTSFSMRAADRWNRAMAIARSDIKSVPAGSIVQLLTFDQHLNAVTDPVVDREKLLAALSRIEPGFMSADYGDVMQRLNTLAGEFDKPVVATLITDAQASNLPVQLNSLVASRLVGLVVRDVSKPDEINYRLSAEARSSDGVHARIAIAVGASATGEAEGRQAKELVVEHEGRVLARKTVMLAPGDARTIVLEQIPLPAQRTTDLDIFFVNNDSLPEDDAVQVPVRGIEPVKIAIAAMGVTPNDHARVFIRTALETDGGAEVIFAPPGNRQLPLDVLHAVVFADLADSAQLPLEVQQFVDNGGNVLVIHSPARQSSIGQSSGAALSNAESYSEANSESIWAEAPANRSTIGRVDDAHPMVLDDINWSTIDFFGSIAMQPVSGDRILLETTDQRPVLIERPVNNGNLLLLADTLDGDVSDFPLQPAFVALIRQVLLYFKSSSSVPESVTAGSLLSLPANAQVLSPDGDALLKLTQTGTKQNLQLNIPGLYTVIGQQANHRVAVVIDAQESDIRQLPEAELRAWEQKQAAGLPAVQRKENEFNTAADAKSKVLRGYASNQLLFWRYLLPLAVLFMFLESVVANRRLSVRRDGS
jgi:hypothetical protein